jgi:3-oxoacyl-[acyl-carrier protein] reductase
MTEALVTGASGGIGSAICQALALRGVKVTLHYRSDRQAAEATRRTLAGENHRLIQADVSDPTSIERLWKEACAGPPIDVVVNNAGVFPTHPPLASRYADWLTAWQRTLATNLLGPGLLSHCAANSMAARGGGRIINVSSRGAFRGEPNMPAYAASKAGLNALSQSMAKALAPRRVYVFAVAPGWVSTPRVAETIKDPAVLADQPLGRVATPDEVAQVVVWCALDAPASLTGAILDVNGASYLRS